jgi:hypothetical protein
VKARFHVCFSLCIVLCTHLMFVVHAGGEIREGCLGRDADAYLFDSHSGPVENKNLIANCNLVVMSLAGTLATRALTWLLCLMSRVEVDLVFIEQGIKNAKRNMNTKYFIMVYLTLKV